MLRICRPARAFSSTFARSKLLFLNIESSSSCSRCPRRRHNSWRGHMSGDLTSDRRPTCCGLWASSLSICNFQLHPQHLAINWVALVCCCQCNQIILCASSSTRNFYLIRNAKIFDRTLEKLFAPRLPLLLMLLLLLLLLFGQLTCWQDAGWQQFGNCFPCWLLKYFNILLQSAAEWKHAAWVVENNRHHLHLPYALCF